MNMLKTRLLALLLAFVLTLSLGVALAETAEEPSIEADHFFAGMKLTYLDGTPFDTSVFMGKPILLNIWATWCPPCIGEMPHLDELAAEYADKINIIGLHAEGLTVTEGGDIVPDEEKNKTALDLQAEMGLTFPLVNPDVTLLVLMNDPKYGVNVSVLPTTWLIDKDGYIRDIIEAAKDKDGWAQTIEDFLQKMEAEENAKTDG